jgi:hypothetical protein
MPASLQEHLSNAPAYQPQPPPSAQPPSSPHHAKPMTLIQRTIVQQIKTALDGNVLAGLIDNATGFLISTVPDIMRELYDTYTAPSCPKR